MEVVYSRNTNNFIKENEINGFYGDLLDLINFGTDVEGIIYDDDWTVKRFLNGLRIKINERVKSVFNYLELDIKILNKKIKELSKTDLKFVLLAYLILHNHKNIIFDYFDVGLIYKDQKKLARVIRNLKNDGFSILIISNNLVFLDTIVENLYVINKGNVVYSGNMKELIKDNSKYIEEPEILRFIEMSNKKGANLDYTLDSKELLKDIYRSVY